MKTIFIALSLSFMVGCVFAGPIHDAASQGDLKTVKALLDSIPDLIKSPSQTGASPLHSATYNGQKEMAEYLLSAGAEINALTNSGSSPLHGAAFYGHPEVVKLLIARGANLNIANISGFVPLLSAASAGHAEIVQSLIEAGADTSARTLDGRLNALQLAVFGGHVQTAQYLLTQGFDIHSVSENGDNFLHAAVMSDSIELIRLGIDNGVDPNKQNNSGDTPLHQAVLSVLQRGITPQKKEIINLLLAKGANINQKNNSGETPLGYAAMIRDNETVKLLIEAGAEINNTNNNGKTPLATAINEGNFNNIQVLLRKGAKTDTKEIHYGMTPLHQAVIGGDLAVVETLLNYTHGINAKDNVKKTSLDYAYKYDHKQIAKLLKSKGGKSDGTKMNNDILSVLKDSGDQGEADMWYLGHCGWAIRTKNHLMIFDYFPGTTQPTEPSLANGYINPEEIKDLNVEVFVSHDHQDHYNAAIYNWQSTAKNITYIFGFKPEELPEAQRQGFAGQAYEYIGAREIKTIDGMQINTIKSNDGGVGFLVETDGVKIFHAGDHAGWDNNISEPFKSEIDYLSALAGNVDMAFINTTGCRYSRDTLALQQSVFYTIEKLSPRATVPTHGMGQEYNYHNYAKKINDNGFKTEVLCADFKGDHFKFTKEP